MDKECVVANPNCNDDVRLSRWISMAAPPDVDKTKPGPFVFMNYRCEFHRRISGYEVVEDQ